MNNYHVIPHCGQWRVLRAGAKRASRILPERRAAIDRARELCDGVLYIHDSNGQVAQRINTQYPPYGNGMRACIP